MNKPKSILFALHHFKPCIGGIERMSFDLAEALSEKGLGVTVACLNKCASKKESLISFERFGKIKVNRFSFLNLKYYLIPFNLPRLFSLAEKHDVIHVHVLNFFSDFFLLTKFIHKKPVFISTHGGMFHTKKLLFFKKLYFNFWLRLILRTADRIIADSQQDADLFEKIASKDRVLLLKNAINLNQFSSSKKKDSLSFLFAGRLSENKRVDLLIKSFKTVVEKLPTAKLFIIGPDWKNNHSKLKKLCDSLKLEKNVFFEGSVSETKLIDYYSKSDFFISASEYEGFGMTTLEAMTSGCIPILNDIPTFTSLVNKNNGLIVDFNASNSSEKILELASNENLKAKLRSQAIKTASETSVENYVRRYIHLIGD